ncbi:MAG TPA: MFS transporter [Nitrososphaerales archaeon]|nr:MFS transporter [Nitrososphaerales archaeon]
MMRVSRDTWAVFTIVTLNSVGWSATMPFLAVYLSAERGVSLGTIGAVYLVAGVLSLGSQLVGGRITDSMGPKRVMLTGYAFSVASALVLSYLIGVDADTTLILVAYPVFNLLRGLAQPASFAIVANSEIGNLKTGLSLLSIAGNLGFAIGPALGGVLAQTFDYSSVFLLSAAVPLVTSLLTVMYVGGGTLKGNEGEPERRSAILRWSTDRNLVLFLMLVVAGYLAIGYEIVPISLYVQKFLSFSSEQIGFLFATNGLLIVLLQLPLSSLFFRAKKLLYPLIGSCLFAALSFVMAGLSSTFLEFEAVMVVLTLGEIFMTVPSQAVLTLFSGVKSRGTFQGYFAAASLGGRSLSPLVGLWSFDIFSGTPQLGWYAIAAFTALLGVGFYRLAEPLQKEFRALGRRVEGREVTQLADSEAQG